MPRECSRYSPFIIVEKISQAEYDSLTIGQLGISRGGLPIERAVSAPDVGIGSNATEMGHPGYVRFSPDSDQRTDIAGCLKRSNPGLMRRSKQHLQSTIFNRAGASLREFELGVCFRSSAGLAQKRTQPVISRSYLKSRQLHLRHRISVSKRLPSRWNLKSSAALQQHYRRSRVHLSLQIDQEATEMEKCDEEIFVGYGWSSSIRHSRSR